ncbi:MAG: DNA-processing protein DprA [Bacteroidetes bacterium]|nr:DNA-processing protein DprA [Rhodothermia bacterium]MCS7154816.1 DNA-processing protein DprA [Bacteroidota bacterium]MCX7907026.1 DNA-processing protein DprA [Bacteroidota bacterium]MDW8137610.1 DNA-processing protein DprA [Bacteroidota bacterium]MDW8285436.1 DNA-processing protein DprA [Bacteroidota bacterium]
MNAPLEEVALLALCRVPGIGPARVRRLVSAFGSPSGVWQATERDLERIEGIGPSLARAILACRDWDFGRRQLDMAAQMGVRFLPFWDPAYPERLRFWEEAPPFLFLRGELRPEDGDAVAIVGTRKPTTYGIRMAEELAAELAQRGLTIVSGLAYGIDAAAHRAALRAGGRTLAVLGSGVNVIYPAAHLQLAREIAAQGALLSEFPLGIRPEAAHFPQRNRTIAALSLGVIVVESAENGGGMITAWWALELNREVFAVPNAAHVPQGRGPNRLIQRGQAKLVLAAEDVLEEIEALLQHRPPTVQAEDAGSEKTPLKAHADLYALIPNQEPVSLDWLVEQTGRSAPELLAALLELECLGLVRQFPGKRFQRAR